MTEAQVSVSSDAIGERERLESPMQPTTIALTRRGRPGHRLGGSLGPFPRLDCPRCGTARGAGHSLARHSDRRCRGSLPDRRSSGGSRRHSGKAAPYAMAGEGDCPGLVPGGPLAKARALVETWSSTYDWRVFERRVNQLPQLMTSIDELEIHFIHVRSPHADALPILLTRGWPGSFAEFLDCIGPLTDPTRYGTTRRSVSRHHSVVAGLRLLGQADAPGLEHRQDGGCVGLADEAARLPSLGHAGRRLGRQRHDQSRPHAPGGAGGDPPELGLRVSVDRAG